MRKWAFEPIEEIESAKIFKAVTGTQEIKGRCKIWKVFYFKQMTGRFGFSDFILGEGEQRRRKAKAVTSLQVFFPSQQ